MRWYLRYSLSLRDVQELFAERGLEADHTRSGVRPHPYFLLSSGQRRLARQRYLALTREFCINSGDKFRQTVSACPVLAFDTANWRHLCIVAATSDDGLHFPDNPMRFSHCVARHPNGMEIVFLLLLVAIALAFAGGCAPASSANPDAAPPTVRRF